MVREEEKSQVALQSVCNVSRGYAVLPPSGRAPDERGKGLEALTSWLLYYAEHERSLLSSGKMDARGIEASELQVLRLEPGPLF